MSVPGDVGADFGIEWRVECGQAPVETLDHLGNDVVRANA